MFNELRRMARMTLTLATIVSPLLGTSAWADRIHLRTGDYFDVDGWREAGDYILYARFGGTITIHKDDVLRIEQRATDPTSWQAPGSSKNPSRPYTVDAPALSSSAAPTSAASAPASDATWSPEPAPTLPKPPARDASKAILATYWENQKQLAMQRMDHYANSKGTCGSRYRTPSVIKACAEGSRQSHRFWNERYIVASREYEKYR